MAGLTDGAEVDAGADPTRADTDRGGVPDGQEVEDGHDPLRPQDDGGRSYQSGACATTPKAGFLGLIALLAFAWRRRSRR